MTKELWLEVLTWRNDPEVYIWNRTNRPISVREHNDWFEFRCARMHMEPIFSYHYSDYFVGMTRLDRNSKSSYEVSLIVNPKSRGMGFGNQLLQDICQYYLKCFSMAFDLIANVHKENIRSQNLFKRNGFKVIATKNDFITFVLDWKI